MAIAAAGAPNRMLTLTCWEQTEPDKDRARAALHAAWRTLRLRIARELAKPPSTRWKPRETAEQRRRRRAANRPDPPKPAPLEALPYFAVTERHPTSGRPHLHILLRCGYIPQRWLSAQMAGLLASPVVDIRKVATAGRAAAYVAKYIGKKPARFAGARAYWYSRNYAPKPAAADPDATTQKAWFTARRFSWPDFLSDITRRRPVIDITADGWLSFDPHAFFGAVIWFTERYSPFREKKTGPPSAGLQEAAD